MDKREQIERALGKAMILRFDWAKTEMVSVRDVANALAEQAIVIECEIVQGAKLVSKAPQTEVHFDPDSLDEYSETYIILPGHPLPEDKALVIILSLEGQD